MKVSMEFKDRYTLLAIMTGAAMAICLAPMIAPNSPPSTPGRLADSHDADDGINEYVAAVYRPTQGCPIVCRNPVHDLGLIMGGKPAAADFVVENLTDQPIWIHVLESCAGTRANTIRCIEPLDDTVVRVSINTTHIVGNFTKTVHVRLIPQPLNAMEILERLTTPAWGTN